MTAFDDEMLGTIERFREAGFALHWLHPKSKRPIGDDWSTKPVATLEALRRRHAAGNNLGVRLGEPSRLIDGTFLHAIDMDIRIPECAQEAWTALRRLLPTVDLPCVVSGSGGESRHLYFTTDRPFSSKRLVVSEGKHRRERAEAKTGEIKQVWSYDWEIELFGTGKQVVLPPSIHPDTGKPYAWAREFDFELLALGAGPHINGSVIESLGVVDTSTFAYEVGEPLEFKPGQLESDLDIIEISDLHYDDWIRLGQALHHQFGGSNEGFDLWLKHTKRSTKFTGEAQIREMRRIKWRSFGKYRGQPVTMATVRQWAQEARSARLIDSFDEVEESDVGDDFDALIGAPADGDEFDAIIGSATAPTLGWMSLLQTTKEGDGWTANLHNVALIVRNDPRLAGLAQINEFTQETVQRIAPGTKPDRRKNQPKPTKQLTGRVWDVKDTLNGELWSDDRDFAIRSILEAPQTQGGYGIKVTDRDLKASIVLSANDFAFHPVREYLNSLTWDGRRRVERLFVDYFAAELNPYTLSVARLMMVGAVTRIFEPGHKFDFAVILEGLQGKRKSTFIEVLGRRWFAELDGDFHDPKQMIELMQGAWILELPELTGFQRGDVRAIKAFISRKKDRARLAYARRAGEFPRQCIFIGSTNDREYLKDDTGGRRFWPMPCYAKEIDTERLESQIDELWAEAVAIYREMRAARPSGTLPLYLTDPEAKSVAARLQESRRIESSDDGLAGIIASWLESPINDGGIDENEQPKYRDRICLPEIWVECLRGDIKAYGQAQAQSIGRAMARVPGWMQIPAKVNPGYGRQRTYERIVDEPELSAEASLIG